MILMHSSIIASCNTNSVLFVMDWFRDGKLGEICQQVPRIPVYLSLSLDSVLFLCSILKEKYSHFLLMVRIIYFALFTLHLILPKFVVSFAPANACIHIFRSWLPSQFTRRNKIIFLEHQKIEMAFFFSLSHSQLIEMVCFTVPFMM